MKKIILASAFFYLSNISSGQPAWEKYRQNKTFTYAECIAAYKEFDDASGQAKLFEYGKTDAGKPLHLFVLSSDKDFEVNSARDKNKCVLMVMNGIHPGEPDGIDASLLLLNDIIQKKIKPEAWNNLIICIIPVYNIDGSLNRSCCSRANQDGPQEYGFRGNSRNLDLNRDFIKCDSENAKSFSRIFQEWDPDVFIDTHVSDGADYPYTMTLIATQHNKLHPLLGEYLKKELSPALFTKMKNRNDEMIHYVNSFDYNDSPDKGIAGFMETPRFSTGYAALFNTIGFVAESHMLKPFSQRVQSTYNLLLSLVELTNSSHEKIISLRQKAKSDCAAKKEFGLQWSVDTSHFELINFKGYEAKTVKSSVTGMDRMYYDRKASYEKKIRFYDEYMTTISVNKPDYYILPQAWKEIIERMKLNKIEMKPLLHDSLIEAEVYYIEKYNAAREPYEGHHTKTKTEVRKETQRLQFYAGDYLIPVNQERNRYIVETLEPQGTDSWFTWGFFDSILQQKEWFSSYVFEDKAEELLKNDAPLKKEFELKKNTDSTFATNSFQQLYFIYRHSPYFEKSYKRYPVARIVRN